MQVKANCHSTLLLQSTTKTSASADPTSNIYKTVHERIWGRKKKKSYTKV